MNVFSLVPGPLIVPYAGTNKNGGRRVVTIKAGRNKIADGTWNAIKDTHAVKHRLDAGMMRYSADTSAELKRMELGNIVGAPNTALITELCAKSAPVDSGAVDGRASAAADSDFLTVDELRSSGKL